MKHLKIQIFINLFILLFFIIFIPSCGVIIGTLVDTAIDISTYPVKEYICQGVFKYDNTWKEPYKKIKFQKDYGDIILGLAVSGGGSRAAYFTACILEELSKVPISLESSKSYLDEVDYISSVSGGSLASAYYCYMKYIKYYNKKQKKEFFKMFKRDMRHNFELEALLSYTLGGMWVADFFTYYDRGDLMADIWDRLFFNRATFMDLLEAQYRGAPILIINGTILNNGLKFVFTTLEDDIFNQSEYFKNIRKAMFITYSTAKSYVPFKTIGFKGINSNILPYRISKAVVASASVPNLLGPVTLKDYRKKRLIHIVDGGVYDNYGIETLMQVITAYLDKHPGKKAKIILIDGSGYFKEDNRENDKFSVVYYSLRPLSIAWLRTKSYMEYVFRKAKEYKNKKGIYPYKNLEFALVSLYDVLPSQQEIKYFTKDRALQHIIRLDITTTNFLKKITTIQTRFSLSSEDAKVIEEVAKKVIKKLICANFFECEYLLKN